MSEPIVAAYTIGQTPRPDLTDALTRRFGSVRFEVQGVLDGIDRADIPPCHPRGYPLETTMSDGSRIVVDASFVAPLLQESVTAMGSRANAHLILCSGPFQKLKAPTPLIRPFEVAVAEFRKRLLRQLEVVVPFADQASPAMDKWGAERFGCRAHVFAERPGHRSVGEWIAGLMRRTRAQALVFDYVGFPPEILEEVAAAVTLPVFDLGAIALDALEQTLE